MSHSFGDKLADMHIKNMHTNRDERWRLMRDHDFVPLFVDGQEQSGRCHHRLLENMPRYGVGMTLTESYSMNICKTNLYPVSLWEGTAGGDHCGKLSGELYLVSPEVLFKLDKVNMNNTYFLRVRKGISFYDPYVPAKDRVRKIATVYMYLGISSYWLPKRTKGELKLMEPLTANDGSPYFNYSIEDDKDAIPF